MITLYQFHPVWGLPSASPFCMKLETYLRMTKLMYEVKYIADPQKAPKGKLPFIRVGNETFTDSELIIDELKSRHGNALDAHLSTEEMAIGTLLEEVCNERLYWHLVYWRWQDDSGWASVKNDFFSQMPQLIKCFALPMVRKKVLNQLHMQGTGRHSKEELTHMAKKSLEAIAQLLGTKKYILGEHPTSYDATLFAFLANILFTPLFSPLKQEAEKFETFIPYCYRMWEAYFPDFTILT